MHKLLDAKRAEPLAKKICWSIHPSKFGYDESVRPNADRTDSGGRERESGVSPSGEEYVIAEVKFWNLELVFKNASIIFKRGLY